MLGLTTPLHYGIFFGYCGLWVSSHLLVYGSRREGAPSYNPTSVVLLTELVKFVMATGMYIGNDGSAKQMAEAARDHWRLLLKYAVPALLYCFYNNLIYINLATFDPGTYNVLMQLKIVLTGVVYQIMFAKRLNRLQWSAIFLITAGCMVKESSKLIGGGAEEALKNNAWRWLSLIVQMLCSVLAGVYTEVLLKGELDARVTTNLQNAMMYFQSMLFNIGYIFVNGKLGVALSLENAAGIFTPNVLAIIVIMSSVGLVTGFFLKHLDSVVKAIAGAFEIVFTMILGYFVFGVPLTGMSMIAAVVVGLGVALYSRPPGQPVTAEAAVAETQLASVVGKASEDDVEQGADPVGDTDVVNGDSDEEERLMDAP